MDNKHAQSIPADVLAQVNAKIAEAIALIKPFSVILTADERASVVKVGDSGFNFVTKVLQYTQTNPEFVPGYLNVAEFEIDVKDGDGHPAITTLINQLYNYFDDTKLAARSEAYGAALYYYGSVQQAASVNLPGAKAIYDDLKQYFASRGSKAVAAK
jgi:hypothetical protein